MLSTSALQPILPSNPISCAHRQQRCARRVLSLRVRADGEKRVDRGFQVLEWTGAVIPQGLLVKGAKAGWRLAWETFMKELAPQTKEGAYSRPSYTFYKSRIGSTEFPAESGRYHIYVGNACPWCHRVVLTLILRGLLSHVSVTWAVDDPERASRGGWVFDTPEPVFGAGDLRQVYDAAGSSQQGYRGRCTAPLIVDKKTKRIISNESQEIVRMLNDLHLPGCTPVDLRPPEQVLRIDALNDTIYNRINNGVYKSGFSTSQVAYDRAQAELYAALDVMELRLSQHRFLLGDRFTESDLWLFPTIIRYDAVYATLFKCCSKRVSDYPNLAKWLQDVYQITVGSPSDLQVRSSISIDDARQSYFGSLFPLNPSGIVPKGPTVEDLRLDDDPGRGSRLLSDIFHDRAASISSARV